MHILSVFINSSVVTAVVVNKETLKIENNLLLNFPFESNNFFINNTRANLDNLLASIKNKFSDKYDIEDTIVTTDSDNIDYEYQFKITSESKILDFVSFYVDPYNTGNNYNLGPNNNDVANYVYYKQKFPIKLSGLYHASLIRNINHKLFTKQIISTYTDIDESFLQKYLENYLSSLTSSNSAKEIKIIFDPQYDLVSYVSALTFINKPFSYELIDFINSIITLNIKIVQDNSKTNTLLLLDDSTKKEYNFIYNIKNG